MYIEELWKEKPDLTIKAVKKIWDIREDRGDSLKFVGISNGALTFAKYGHHSFSIIIKDFEVYDCKPNSKYNIEWIKFMKSVFGGMYVYRYLEYRNKKLDKFIEEYKNDYDKETKEILVELGRTKYKDEQNQTK